MISPDIVVACLVTRGDRPEAVQRIVNSLIFPQVVVWDNSRAPDWKCAGRYMAAAMANSPWVYFQDDDTLVPRETQQDLCDLAGHHDCVANYGHGENPDGYGDLPLVCGGAIAWKQSCWSAIAQYAARWPLDDEFMYESDFVVGALYRSWLHAHLPFEIDMDIAQAPERLCNQPWQRDLKLKITNRAREIRDERLAA